MFQKEEKEKVFSKMVRAGRKNYFFDVKKASNGKNYLTIAESSIDKDGNKKVSRFLLFQDQFADFAGALSETRQYFQ